MILDRLVIIIVKQMDRVSKVMVVAEAKFVNDLGADSLDFVEIIMSVEEEFDVAISDEILMRIKTVGDLMDAIISAERAVTVQQPVQLYLDFSMSA
jgi:acyl carrier protein